MVPAFVFPSLKWDCVCDLAVCDHVEMDRFLQLFANYQLQAFTCRPFILSLATIILSPLLWNIYARLEFHTHILTKLFGSAKRGCYFLAVVIFISSDVRDYLFKDAVFLSPSLFPALDALFASWEPYLTPICIAAFLAGLTLTWSSMWRLGITGTYLGDYFGILMKEKVTGFPYNVCNSPMYTGASIQFIASALFKHSSTGLVLALATVLCYRIALVFEDSFTAYIYSSHKDNKD
ncbi:putative phospholipid methyltransferase [Paratrimastix pyriformis]|uniref:Phosphatidylethanolamine N-methyltransferase n=1 Tax=Paratrimastix pyriformis TaxID=342808 RepID=A0ABQ8UDT8_9EUKA|nr:putative phospholipid methyltransferase [Paratrimastix pyriformis]